MQQHGGRFIAAPYIDGSELWLERLALLAIWELDGLPGIYYLIEQHIRPILLLYLRNKADLDIAHRISIANALIAAGFYDSPLGEFDRVLEKLQGES